MSETIQPADAADPHAFSLLDAIVSGRCPKDWASEWFEDWLGPRERATLLLCNKACSEWVLQTAEEATCTLLSYSGTSADLCTQRVAVASRSLATRGKLPTRLVVHQPSANQAALAAMAEQLPQDSLQGVTAVELRNDEPYPTTVCTAWLRAVSRAFVNLTSLSVHHLTGILPPHTTLPKLRELSLRIAPSELPTDILTNMCASIATYVTQITSLSLTNAGKETQYGRRPLPCDAIFTTPSTTLAKLTTDEQLTDKLIPVLVKFVPALKHLSCGGMHYDMEKDWYEELSWAVEQLTSPGTSIEKLRKLPRSVSGSMVLRPAKADQPVLYFRAETTQGLSIDATNALGRFKITEPCQVILSPSHLFDAEGETDKVKPAILAAIHQLTDPTDPTSPPFLPSGSTIQLQGVIFPRFWGQIYNQLFNAADAAAADLARRDDGYDVFVWTPHCEVGDLGKAGGDGGGSGSEGDGDDSGSEGDLWGDGSDTGSESGGYCSSEDGDLNKYAGPPGLWCHSLTSYGGMKEWAGMRSLWPWRALRLQQDVSLVGFLKALPSAAFKSKEPMAVIFDGVDCQLKHVCKVSSKHAFELYTRLNDIRFFATDSATITLQPPKGTATADQPAALRQQLELLRMLRCQALHPGVSLTVALNGWDLTESLIWEIGYLRNLALPCIMKVTKCTWPALAAAAAGGSGGALSGEGGVAACRQLVANLPACFTAVHVRGSTMHPEKVIELCAGALTRSQKQLPVCSPVPAAADTAAGGDGDLAQCMGRLTVSDAAGADAAEPAATTIFPPGFVMPNIAVPGADKPPCTAGSALTLHVKYDTTNTAINAEGRLYIEQCVEALGVGRRVVIEWEPVEPESQPGSDEDDYESDESEGDEEESENDEDEYEPSEADEGGYQSDEGWDEEGESDWEEIEGEGEEVDG